MRDKDERDADLLLDFFQLALHVLAQLEVERAERLVEQQHLRLVDQCARNGDALLLSAGHLVDAALFKARKTHEAQHTADLLLDDILRFLFEIQAEGDVVIYVEVREQRIFLEYGVDLALVRRQA